MITLATNGVTVTDGESYHDMEEHGLGSDGIRNSMGPLGIAAEVFDEDESNDLTSQIAITLDAAATAFASDHGPATPLLVKITGRRGEMTTTIYSRSCTPTPSEIVHMVAESAALGEVINAPGSNEFADLGAADRLDRDALVAESNAIRDALIAAVGRDEAGWLMHGLDAEQFGYRVVDVDAQ